MALSDVESLQNSLRLIVEIRSKASELFKTVLEGSSGGANAANALAASKEDGQNRETKYLSEVKLKLDVIDTKTASTDRRAK